MKRLVHAARVCKTFREGMLETPVLFDVDLDVPGGELALLMGPSGSGKTTLISILAGMMHPTSGYVELCGVPISELDSAASARVRRDHLGFIFQQYNLFPALTALDNVAEVLRLKGFPIRQARERAATALEGVGLGDRMGHRPGQLSGGQRQRVAIARAMAGDPSLLVGDEPTAALDSRTGLAIIELLRAQVSETRSVLIVTHDHRLERYADRVIEIEDGRIQRIRTGEGAGRSHESARAHAIPLPHIEAHAAGGEP